MTLDATITAVSPADARDPPRSFVVSVRWAAGAATFACTPVAPPKIGDRWSFVAPELVALRDGPGWEEAEEKEPPCRTTTPSTQAISPIAAARDADRA